MKKYLIISLLTLILSVTMVAAATTDFTSNGSITISSVLGSAESADLTIMNESSTESWTYDADGRLKVTNPDSTNTFKVGSASAAMLSIHVEDIHGVGLVCADNTTPGTSYVTLPTSAGVYTVFATKYACARESTGGGGGGGPKKPKAPKVLPIVPATPTPAAPALANASPNAAFNRALQLGSTGEDVKNLQKFLNGNGFAVAVAGIGSVGNETTVFGRATEAAVIKFQLAKGLIASATDLAAGFVGPKTRVELNGLNSAAPASDNQALIQSLTAQLQELVKQLNALKAAQGL